jgi:hypothetical protein
MRLQWAKKLAGHRPHAVNSAKPGRRVTNWAIRRRLLQGATGATLFTGEKSSQNSVEPLPHLYAGWVAEFLGPVPRESRATCETCAMCSPAGEQPDPRGYYFDPATKCCTFLPDLPNFLVGRILSGDDRSGDPGRASVVKRIRARVAVTPLGLGPHQSSNRYDTDIDTYGRAHDLRCPHYIEESGRCGIWNNREAVCATWFCKHVRGSVGHTFWQSLRRTLKTVEANLARWCVLELSLGDDALRRLTGSAAWDGRSRPIAGESTDNLADEEHYGRIWGAWAGREADFFARCAELVNPLSWNDVLAICGPRALESARLSRQAYARLISDDLPAVLSTAATEISHMGPEAARVGTYSPYDPVDLPLTVMALLHYFDGRPTEQAIELIASKTGTRLERAFVRKLVDFGVLVPRGRPGERA